LKGVGFIMYLHAHDIDTSISAPPSILKMMEQVKCQVEYHCFAPPGRKWVDPFYRELCLVIAETLILDSNTILTINGTKMPALLVQEVFGQLRNGHLRLVFENFRNVTSRIYNKMYYLRTALYNVVFEFESHYINDMNCD